MDKTFFKEFDKQVEEYKAQGVSTPQAVSLVAKKHGVNPYKIMSVFYSDDKASGDEYRDIKTEEGSFVTLKGDNNGSQYEVININNKDAIVLRNTDNNEEIVASETELTPVITENEMNKINEAQYSVSINGLETQDAGALSQLFTAANQAEQGQGIDMSPMPMDMGSGMPMDMGMDVAPDMGGEDDIVFDEELPADVEIGGDISMGAPMEAPTEAPADVPSEMPSEDISGEEAPIEDMSMDDMMGDGMFEESLNDVLRAAGVKLDEAEEIIPGDDFINDFEDDGDEKGEQEQYAEELTEDAINPDEDMPQRFFEISNIEYDLESDGEAYGAEELGLPTEIKIEARTNEEGADLEDTLSNLISEETGWAVNSFNYEEVSQSEELQESDEEVELSTDNPFGVDEAEDTLDEELNAVFKAAGVKLDEEAVKTVKRPTKVATVEERKIQSPEYKEVDTTTFGKEASEGAKQPLNITCESTVNKDKIKSIFETAQRMYAKKDTKDWASLDRRYIEKLIKEGCSYGTSTKLLMEAKKGK